MTSPLSAAEGRDMAVRLGRSCHARSSWLSCGSSARQRSRWPRTTRSSARRPQPGGRCGRGADRADRALGQRPGLRLRERHPRGLRLRLARRRLRPRLLLEPRHHPNPGRGDARRRYRGSDRRHPARARPVRRARQAGRRLALPGTAIRFAGLASVTSPRPSPREARAPSPPRSRSSKPREDGRQDDRQGRVPPARLHGGRRAEGTTRRDDSPGPRASRLQSWADQPGRRPAPTSATGSTSTPGSSPAPGSAGGTVPRRSRP